MTTHSVVPLHRATTGTHLPPQGPSLADKAASRQRWRILRSRIWWGTAWLCAAIIGLALAHLIGTVIWHGIRSFSWKMLVTPTQGIAGGLENAILGTGELILLSVAIAAPLGVLGGVYVAEFARPKTAGTIRFITEVLSGLPSIVVGYFGYVCMVLGLGWGFSALAGAVALAVIMLPYILRNTDAALMQVPLTLREGAWALGMTRFQAIRRVVAPCATGGIATGILLAIALGMGETAPLLYTAGWSSFNPTGHLIGEQVGYLTYVIWTYIDQPYPEAHALAYSAAFILMLFILAIHLFVRWWVQRRKVVY